MWECCKRRNNKLGVLLFCWLRAHLIKLEIPFLFGETSFASIRLGVILVALVVAANTRQPQSETERLKKKKKSMSERPRQPEYGFGSEMAKTEFKFPILVMYVSLEFH
jgi:hypothetical protein